MITIKPHPNACVIQKIMTDSSPSWVDRSSSPHETKWFAVSLNTWVRGFDQLEGLPMNLKGCGLFLIPLLSSWYMMEGEMLPWHLSRHHTSETAMWVSVAGHSALRLALSLLQEWALCHLPSFSGLQTILLGSPASLSLYVKLFGSTFWWSWSLPGPRDPPSLVGTSQTLLRKVSFKPFTIIKYVWEIYTLAPPWGSHNAHQHVKGSEK